MRTIFIILLSLCCLRSVAQRFELGLAYQHVIYSGSVLQTYSPGTFQSPSTSVQDKRGSAGMFGLDFSYYHPVYITGNEDFSFGPVGGIRPLLWIDKQKDTKNIQGQTIQSGSSSGDFAFQVPLCISARYGALAIADSYRDFGIALGFGMMYHTFEYGTVVGDRGSQFSPVAKIELGGANFTVNGYWVISSYQSKYESSLGDIPKITYHTFGVSVNGAF